MRTRIPRQSLSGWLFVQRPWTEVDFFEGTINPADAVRVGWTALRAALSVWGVAGQDDLTQWLRDQRFAGAQPGNHIPARAQEFLFSEGFDARVALLEAFFVRLT